MDDDDLMMTDDQKSEMAGLISHDEVNHEQRQTQLLLEQEQAEADLAIFQACTLFWARSFSNEFNLNLKFNLKLRLNLYSLRKDKMQFYNSREMLST